MPLIAVWPGTIPEGVVEHAPVAVVDWFPTLIAETGASRPAGRTLDGSDLGLLLRGQGARGAVGPRTHP